jgi:hypothetical protein
VCVCVCMMAGVVEHHDFSKTYFESCELSLRNLIHHTSQTVSLCWTVGMQWGLCVRVYLRKPYLWFKVFYSSFWLAFRTLAVLQIFKVTRFQVLLLFLWGTTVSSADPLGPTGEVNLKDSALKSLASESPEEEASELCRSHDGTNNTVYLGQDVA